MKKLDISDVTREVDEDTFMPYLKCTLEISLEFIQDLRAKDIVEAGDYELGAVLRRAIEKANANL